MAKVFVEDCLGKIENRFLLVVLAAHRARAIRSEKAPLIPTNGSNVAVIALREIAATKVQPKELHTNLIESLQTRIEVDVPEPAIPAASVAVDHQSTTSSDEDIRFDLMSEEELLAGIKGIVKPELQEEDADLQETAGGRNRRTAPSPTSSRESFGARRSPG